MFNKKKFNTQKKKFNAEDVRKGLAEHKQHLLNLCETMINRFNSLEANISRLSQRMSNSETVDMLTQALCDKYTKGTFIMYDEHKPREVVIIKDGKRIDMSNATSASFSWYAGDFPSLSIDRK